MATKQESIKSYRISQKDMQLICHPRCKHTYIIWLVLFSQLDPKLQDYHLNIIKESRRHTDIPIIKKNKVFLFYKDFHLIYFYFLSNEKLALQFRAYENTNEVLFIKESLKEIKKLLSSGLFQSIKGLDIIVDWLNKEFKLEHLQDAFGVSELNIDNLRKITNLSKVKTPKTRTDRRKVDTFFLSDILMEEVKIV